ncbi:major capsid protein [Deinococcus misasensis]|uniref:major capsid protein n=1 Tax=Deinococcus misasensis TaxID=392413 RepID=UPI0005594886|nr:major capsid protein [Deinococcus misasensis]
MNGIAALVATMIARGFLGEIANNARAQFGVQGRQYLGATLLPERLVPENMYTETDISYRTMLANAGTRYSPAVKKGSAMVGDMKVELGNIDVASEFTAEVYDALQKILGRNEEMEALASVTGWLDNQINLALRELMEKHRWEALADAQVLRKGANGYEELVTYSNPAGHRVTIDSGSMASPEGWYDPDHNPLEDIDAQVSLLSSKGFTADRIITSRSRAMLAARHPKTRAAMGRFTIDNTGNLQSQGAFASITSLSAFLVAEGLPPIQTYDLMARTENGTIRFLDETKVIIASATGRDQTIDLGDEAMLLQNTLGYTAVGRAAGQATPGIVIRMEHFENKPPRIEGEGWATTLPVVQEPEAIAVLTVPNRTA